MNNLTTGAAKFTRNTRLPANSNFLVLLHPLRIGIDETLQERLHRFGQRTRLIKRFTGTTQISLGLLHHWHIEKNHGLTQVMVRTKSTDCTR
ncbi:hypothetical protein D3C81_2066590 [compost metagenome]